MHALGIFSLAALAGVAFSLQGPINAGLARHVGGAPAAALLSFLVAAVTMVAVYAVAAGVGHGGAPTTAGVPRHLYLAGCLGVVGIVLMTIAVPRVGVSAAVAAMIGGQVVTALVTDRFGWFGGAVIELSPRRLIGAGLVLVGVWLVRR